MTICTDAFLGLARDESRSLGMPDLALAIIRHPIGGEAPDVIRGCADDALAQVVRALLGDAVTGEPESGPGLGPRRPRRPS